MTNLMTSIDASTLSNLQNSAVSHEPQTSSAVRMRRYYVPDGEIHLYSGGDQLIPLLNGGTVAR